MPASHMPPPPPALGRFAPSPSGPMHLGNAFVALLSWLWAKQQKGRWLLRIEDLDCQRSKPEYSRLLLEDLRFLGLPWDEKPLLQSQRHHLYAHALSLLKTKGLCFTCHCSRKDMALSLAPHAGQKNLSCTGRCRPNPNTAPSLRFRCAPLFAPFEDAILGTQYPRPSSCPADFVLWREGQYSYQLAVVVDDAAQGVNQVLRGADLVDATFCQRQLQMALGLPSPTYAHVPCVENSHGERLAKRTKASSIATLRERGMSGPQVVGLLAQLANLGDGSPSSPEKLLSSLRLSFPQCLQNLRPRVGENLLQNYG